MDSLLPLHSASSNGLDTVSQTSRALLQEDEKLVAISQNRYLNGEKNSPDVPDPALMTRRTLGNRPPNETEFLGLRSRMMAELSLGLLLVGNLFVASAQTFRPNNIPSGLVGYWKLDEVSGTRLDSSGRGNHLSPVNNPSSGLDAPLGLGERSADFERDNGQYLKIADTAQSGLDLNGSYTIVFWMKPESLPDGWYVQKGGANGVPGYIVLYRGATSTINLVNTSPQTEVVGPVISTTGQWLHFAVVFDNAAATAKFYVNGVLAVTRTMAATPSDNTWDFFVGAGAYGDQTDGLLKDVAIWNLALSTVQIESLAAGSDLSNTPPLITRQPQNQTAVVGATVTFSVEANGKSPLSFQWYKNGLPISNGTSQTLTLSTVQASDAGTYSVLVSNSLGSITSSGASLVVNTRPFRPDDIPSGLVGYWKLDEVSGTRLDSSGNGNNLADANGVGNVVDDPFGLGERSADFERDRGQYLSISDQAQRGLDLTGSYTIVFWMKAETLTDMRIIEKGGYNGIPGYIVIYRSSTRTINLVNTSSVQQEVVGPVVTTIGQWLHFAVVYDSNASSATFLVNGDVAAVQSLPTKPADTSSVFFLGAGATGDQYDGLLKDAAIWNRPLTGLEVKSLATGTDLSNTPPTITREPQSANVHKGRNVTFSVEATGKTPLSYQWRKNGVDLLDGGNVSGATTPSLTLAAVQESDRGTYSVVVHNVLGSVTSADAVLQVSAGLFRPDDIPSGLVGYWKLDETSGARLDSSGRGNHLTTPIGTSSVGSVADNPWGTPELSADFFRGNREFLTITDGAQSGLDLIGSYTIAFWVKARSFGEATRFIEKGAYNGVPGYTVILRTSTSGGINVVNANPAQEEPLGPIFNTKDRWVNLAFVYDSVAHVVTYFVDGQVAKQNPMATSPIDSAVSFCLGGSFLGDYFDGFLKDVAIWNRTLTALQVGSLAAGVDLSNRPPTPLPDSYSSREDTKLDVPASGVLANDADPDGDSLKAELENGPANGVLNLKTDGSFSYIPAADFNGTDSFTYRTSDGKVKSEPVTVSIDVNAVNDPPSFIRGPDLNVLEDAGTQSVPNWATQISAGPGDESGQSVMFQVSNNNGALFSVPPAISPTGVLTFTPAPNANGIALVTASLVDNGGTANGGLDTSAPRSFTITVIPVNDAPYVANSIPDQPGQYGSTFTFTVSQNTFADVDAADTLTLSASGLPPGLSFNPSTRQIAGTPTQAEAFQVTVTATDNGTPALSAAASFKVTITKAPLTVTANSTSKVYGSPNPSFSVTITGFVNGDNASVVSGAPAFSTLATAASPVGSYVITPSLGTLSAANYSFVNFKDGTLSVNRAPLTVTANSASKAYGSPNPSFSATITSFVNGDNASVVSGAPAFSTPATAASPVGSYVITASLGTLSAANYSFANFVDGTLNVAQASLTVRATGLNKPYDATTAATVTLSDDRIPGDVFTASYASASFADKNVGIAKTVTVTGITISGPDAGNYSPNTSATTTADITARTLTISADGQNRPYDGTATATVTLTDNRIPGDVFADSYASASFADKKVGIAKTVTVTGIAISGPDANNYTANPTASTTADITPRGLTVSASAQNKTYDGTTTAIVSFSDNRLVGDGFTVSRASASFADKHVGSGKTVTVTGIALSGPDAGNYTANSTASTTADITPRGLTVSATAQNKTYDGTTVATVVLSDNRLVGDGFTVSRASASFADKHVGSGKTVTVSGIALSGPDAGNYTANSTASASADITPRGLTVSATAQNKTYDGTTVATVVLSDNRLVGDVFAVSYASAAFADKHVGSGKTVTVSGIALSGPDAGNYTANSTATTTADITPRGLTVSASAQNKTYDGTAAATVSLSDNRVPGDVFTSSYSNASFADKDVGLAKTVNVSGITISGPDAGNYSPNTSATTTANITKAPLIAQADDQSRLYGAPNPPLTISYSRFVNGEGLSVLDAPPVAVTAADAVSSVGRYVISLSGGTDNNYAFELRNGTLEVTKATLIARADDKVRLYGTPNPPLTISYTGFVNGDDPSVQDAPPVASTVADVLSPVGRYAITLSGGTDNNYGFELRDGTLEVITANQALSGLASTLATLLTQPGLTPAAQQAIQNAIDNLIGQNGGAANNGAVDQLDLGNVEAALVKIRKAIEDLSAAEDASNPRLDFSEYKIQLSLSAKSAVAVVLAQAESAAKTTQEKQKVDQAKTLLEQGQTLLNAGNYLGAVDKFLEALSSLKSVAKKSVITVRGSELELGISRISIPSRETDLRLSVRGPAGATVELERSDDLERWEAWHRIELDRSGRAEIDISSSGVTEAYFYRVR